MPAGSGAGAAPPTPRPLRILHVVGRSQRRGAEIAARELAAALDRRGHHNRVVAACPGFDGSTAPDLRPLTRTRAMGPRALAAGAWRLRRTVIADPVDVVLAHGGWAMQVAAVASVGRAFPALVWQRILAFPEVFWRAGWRARGRRRWWRWITRRGRAGVALTAELDRELRALGFTGPVWTIGNSRDPARFAAVDRDTARGRLRRELGLPVDAQLIGLVGHLIDQKRPERALAVLDEARALGTAAHLVVAGDGPQRAAFEADAARRGVAGAVHLLGERPDVEWVLAGVDLLVLVSDAEGIPGVVIEAQMAGCPVVTYPLGGVEAVVADGETGVVTARAEPAAVAAAVRDLLGNDELRARLGARAAARARAEFSTARAAERYEAALRGLLAHVSER